MTLIYQCDNCDRRHRSKVLIFHCLGCSKEICDTCMDGYSHCRECANRRTSEEVLQAWNESQL